MLVTEESKSGEEVLLEIVDGIMEGTGSHVDHIVGNFRIIDKRVIDDIMYRELGTEKEIVQFPTSLLSSVLGLTKVFVDVLKNYNVSELLSLMTNDGVNGMKLKDLCHLYVEADGYGDHFAYDGECTEVGIYYVFKIGRLDQLVG